MSAAPSGSTEGPPARDPGTQTVKAVVVTVIAVLIAVLVLHHKFSSGAASAAGGVTPTTKPHVTTTTLNVTNTSATTTVAPVSPANIRLQVLNGIGTGNYAGEFSVKLHASPGYNTLVADDATAKVQMSQIYIVTAGYLPEAKALAATLGLSASSVVATVPPPSTAPIPAADLTKSDLVLVIGPDLEAKA